MSLNEYELNHMLVDESVNLYAHDNLNKLIIADDENLNHFSAISILFYILAELNHDVICDYHVIGFDKFDLYDITNRTVYQIENADSVDELRPIKNDILLQKDVEIIIIFLEDLPDDLFQRYLKLKEYVFSD